MRVVLREVAVGPGQDRGDGSLAVALLGEFHGVLAEPPACRDDQLVDDRGVPQAHRLGAVDEVAPADGASLPVLALDDDAVPAHAGERDHFPSFPDHVPSVPLSPR